jgi:hypothetical protein
MWVLDFEGVVEVLGKGEIYVSEVGNLEPVHHTMISSK